MLRFRVLVALIAAHAAAAAGAGAQEPAAAKGAEVVVAGVVRDGAFRPVRGARVSVVETELATWTDESGGYRLRLPAEGAPAGGFTLRVEAEGYRPAESRLEPSPGTPRHDVVLAAEAVPLDALTVAAQLGDSPRRAATARVDAIDAAAVVDAGAVASVAELIQARVPGVSVFRASGTPGTSSQVRIRGIHTASAVEDLAVYVDGVRVEAGPLALIDVGGQAVDGLAGLAPEDVESIEVVKGPASALWLGPESAAGAILITTKREPVGSRRFSQRLTLEYGPVEPRFELPANWVRCGDFTSGACETLPPGTILSDRPLERDGVLGNGSATTVHWSGRAGGRRFGAYGSANWSREEGVLPNSGATRRGARLGLRLQPLPSVELDVALSADRLETGLPLNDDAMGFLSGALLGNPATLGTPEDGWKYAPADSLALVRTDVSSRRYVPSLRVTHRVFPWLAHRLIAGTDQLRSEGWQVDSLSGVARAESNAVEAEREVKRRTIDYQARLSPRRGPGSPHAFELRLGLQSTRFREESFQRSGLESSPGVIDTARASEVSVRLRHETRALIIDGRYGYRDRFFWEAGARLDHVNGGDTDVERLRSYRVGASYVASDGRTRPAPLPGIGAVRLHAAIGEMERRPGIPLEIYFAPASPGSSWPPRNERIRAIEAGFELGTAGERLSLDVTAFQSTTYDMAYFGPGSPARGYGGYAQYRGEVRNRGVEARLAADLVRAPDFTWTARLGVAGLDNEVVALDHPAFSFGLESRLAPGYPVAAFFARPILGADTAAGHALAGDSAVYAGSVLPSWEAAVDTDFALWRRLRIRALFDWRTGFRVYDAGAVVRDALGVSEGWAKRGELSETEALMRFGPYRDSVGPVSILHMLSGDTFDDGRFLRLRELSATLELPRGWAERIGAGAAQLTLAGRNVALWSAYGGADPEVLTSPLSFERRDYFTLPQVTRWTGRLTVQF